MEHEFYEEVIYRFRVMRCMNDELRNPEKEWDLVFSSSRKNSAETVCKLEAESNKKFGDEFKVVDFGAETVLNREVY